MTLARVEAQPESGCALIFSDERNRLRYHCPAHDHLAGESRESDRRRRNRPETLRQMNGTSDFWEFISKHSERSEFMFSAGAQEPERTRKYVRIPSTAGT